MGNKTGKPPKVPSKVRTTDYFYLPAKNFFAVRGEPLPEGTDPEELVVITSDGIARFFNDLQTEEQS